MNAHEFLVTFMLTNRITWDKTEVADAITWASSESELGTVELVMKLAEKLRNANAKQNRQTSAASKITLFQAESTNFHLGQACEPRGETARLAAGIAEATARFHQQVVRLASTEVVEIRR